MTQLIANRKIEVESAIARLMAEVNSYRKELDELDTAQRVLDRLSGASGRQAGAGHQPATAAALISTSANLSLPQMIFWALAEARQVHGLRGLEPKKIAESIERLFGVRGKADHVASVCWRLCKRGDLVKLDDKASSYSLNTASAVVVTNIAAFGFDVELPTDGDFDRSVEKEKAANAVPVQGALTALINHSSGGDETVRGGGT